MIRAAAPHLRKSPQGAIVNVSSHSGINGDGSSLAYAASKGALNTMTIGLARSLAPSIRVNAVCPGFVDTTWALAWQDEDSYRDFRGKVAAMAALKSIPGADDIADSIVWLAGPKSRCVTGQLLVIDGGTHLVVAGPL
jgi:3-oxoacyl-[acyl-carrier protein] reductase